MRTKKKAPRDLDYFQMAKDYLGIAIEGHMKLEHDLNPASRIATRDRMNAAMDISRQSLRIYELQKGRKK